MSFDFEKKKKSKKKKFFFVVLFSFSLFVSWKLLIGSTKNDNPIESTHARKVLGVEDFLETSPQEKEKSYVEYMVSEGDIPADVFFSQAKWDANDIANLLDSSKDIYDFTNLKIGRKLRFFFLDGEKATRMEYDRDTERSIICDREEKKFSVREEVISYAIEKEKTEITIDSFFYADALESGLTESTILDLADVFAYAIDFSTEIQQGDYSEIVYEKRYKDGERGPDGRVLVASFENSGKKHFAYYFEHEGKSGYYDEEGREIVRQFLKAPLNFRRITSGFTGARLHPITRTVSAHYQIDYSASVGTPVVSTARGTLISATWEGGWGNMVRIRHDNGYTTHYAHLSAFAKGVKSGGSISQGQVIGYVGSTGWSTGPHLDYGMKLNGAPINPLKIDQPKGPLLEGELLEKFWEQKSQYDQLLN
ncbi:MAG: peptidoglycan DD-metalloendopeptidase family protein [Candidatus Moraniibacteriota bacterium]|nr:MAG: peptidoglycan DD-metalloendopeptidase family protein [Candidatus Moranbacteria bacterium]